MLKEYVDLFAGILGLPLLIYLFHIINIYLFIFPLAYLKNLILHLDHTYGYNINMINIHFFLHHIEVHVKFTFS